MTIQLRPLAIELTPTQVARELRGRIYQARLRLSRLEHAWPVTATRTERQRAAITQARAILEMTEDRARSEGVDPASVSTFGTQP